MHYIPLFLLDHPSWLIFGDLISSLNKENGGGDPIMLHDEKETNIFEKAGPECSGKCTLYSTRDHWVNWETNQIAARGQVIK